MIADVVVNTNTMVYRETLYTLSNISESEYQAIIFALRTAHECYQLCGPRSNIPLIESLIDILNEVQH
jgi:hypothetical protein